MKAELVRKLDNFETPVKSEFRLGNGQIMRDLLKVIST